MSFQNTSVKSPNAVCGTFTSVTAIDGIGLFHPNFSICALNLSTSILLRATSCCVAFVVASASHTSTLWNACPIKSFNRSFTSGLKCSSLWFSHICGNPFIANISFSFAPSPCSFCSGMIVFFFSTIPCLLAMSCIFWLISLHRFAISSEYVSPSS